jgi:hypothetical protein
MIDVLLNALLPIFAVMALGYLAGWIRDVDNDHAAGLNALVMDFALPASLFVATATTPRTLLLAQWPLLLVLAILWQKKSRPFARTSWWWTQSRETGLQVLLPTLLSRKNRVKCKFRLFRLLPSVRILRNLRC